jgi:hypothetical protein
MSAHASTRSHVSTCQPDGTSMLVTWLRQHLYNVFVGCVHPQGVRCHSRWSIHATCMLSSMQSGIQCRTPCCSVYTGSQASTTPAPGGVCKALCRDWLRYCRPSRTEWNKNEVLSRCESGLMLPPSSCRSGLYIAAVCRVQVADAGQRSKLVCTALDHRHTDTYLFARQKVLVSPPLANSKDRMVLQIKRVAVELQAGCTQYVVRIWF